VLVNLSLVVFQCRVCHRAHGARLLLGQVRVGRRQVGTDWADDGARGICDRVLVVGVLERRARTGVLGGLGNGGVVVNDGVAMVGDFGVGDGAAGFGVAGVVVRVVGREDGGGGSHDGADLLGRHGYVRVVVECVVRECLGVGIAVLKNSCCRLYSGWSMCKAREQDEGIKKQRKPTALTPGTCSTLLSVFKSNIASSPNPAPALLILLTTRVSALSRSRDWVHAVKLPPLLPVQNLSR
jgi:hypothetical protein